MVDLPFARRTYAGTTSARGDENSPEPRAWPPPSYWLSSIQPWRRAMGERRAARDVARSKSGNGLTVFTRSARRPAISTFESLCHERDLELALGRQAEGLHRRSAGAWVGRAPGGHQRIASRIWSTDAILER